MGFPQSSERIFNSEIKGLGLSQKRKWAYRLQGWNAHFSGVYGHRMCLLFSKILYTYLQCALVSRKTESAFFIEIFAYLWTNAEKMSVVWWKEKQKICGDYPPMGWIMSVVNWRECFYGRPNKTSPHWVLRHRTGEETHTTQDGAARRP